jgi:hypothetical protein
MARRNQTIWLVVLAQAVALLWYWQHRPSTAPVIPKPNLETFNGCGMEGDASSSAVRELNLLKNRYAAPEPQQIDPRVTLAASSNQATTALAGMITRPLKSPAISRM